MTHILVSLFISSILVALLWLIFSAAIIRRLFSPTVRHAIWWLICVKFLIALAPIPSITIHFKPAQHPEMLAASKAIKDVKRITSKALTPSFRIKRARIISSNIVSPKLPTNNKYLIQSSQSSKSNKIYDQADSSYIALAVLMVIWVIGAAVLLSRSLISLIRLKQVILKS
jgi:beta-lactamase regulating signal transducer with metallopeptidase domain